MTWHGASVEQQGAAHDIDGYSSLVHEGYLLMDAVDEAAIAAALGEDEA